MKKNTSLYATIIIIVLLYGIFFQMMPQSYDKTEAPLSEFSTKRALEKVKKMCIAPHFVGSKNHDKVADYLIHELHSIGLEATYQEGFTMTEKGTLVKAKNIIAKIKGTSSKKALLLLSHYDSAPHSSSNGASDDAAGVATILEGIRTFLHNKTQHKNDIIVLFTDAEELGLNGAALFVTQHQWAKTVGLALNFEARGSSGPSYMLMETNYGNAAMIAAFEKGNPKYINSNSLMYSIYKMLPNDTDLTVFREKGGIQGFNFAFIDSHFNYHTMQDTYENLMPETLAHQGSYLMPLLYYFANADLNTLNSKKDKVYFNIPFGFISYPFDWIFPMLIAVGLLFILIVFTGLAKQVLRIDEIIKGFVIFISLLLTVTIIVYFGWKLILVLYPQYEDILQGFTYNGHDYVYGFICITLAICFLFYQKKLKKQAEMSWLVGPLFLWLIINIAISIKLKGAAFLMIPVLTCVLCLGYYVYNQKTNRLINLILGIPTLVILAPFIQMFPIGLGLKIMAGSALLTALSFALLLPVFITFTHKKRWAVAVAVCGVAFFGKAHQNADYKKGTAKPNSLNYIIDNDTNKAYWATYDTHLDEWTKGYLGEHPKRATLLNKNKLYSKYNSEYTYMTEAPMHKVPQPTITFLADSTVGRHRNLKIQITPNRNVNRYDIFANEKLKLTGLKANGVTAINVNSNIIQKNSTKIVTYYVTNNNPLVLEFSIASDKKLEMSLIESSFDLLTNPQFSMSKRRDWMIPTPFVLNDAVILQQSITKNDAAPVTTPSNQIGKYRRTTPKLNNPNDTIN